MTGDRRAQFGVIGMAVMGRNLALNIVDHGFEVAIWNRSPEPLEAAVAESGGRLIATSSLEDLVGRLETPRRVMTMIKAGKPVDVVLEQLLPLLDAGDIVIDGGNSWFEDTRRREQEMAKAGVRFFGVGVSGGEEGARHGPSLMPGGDACAYEHIVQVLEAIAAKTDSGPCVTHVGPDGAGHFVKMVHNGIEYADMQAIAEAYHLLRDLGEMSPPALSDVFGEWNRGLLESFLIEITAKIFSVSDGDGWLIEGVLDKAGQKGTGRWTAQVALDLAVPVPSIAAAIDARVLSSQKKARVAAQDLLRGPDASSIRLGRKELVASVHDALVASKVVAYAQGMALIKAGSERYGWTVDLREIARIWKGGCIIRAQLLNDIMLAYERTPELTNLLLDVELGGRVQAAQSRWRQVVASAQLCGIPVPAMSASLAYFDSVRSARLPQNLTQAQRDAFGAHTYQRNDTQDIASAPFVHSEWLR